jgi:hypothetical protein
VWAANCSPIGMRAVTAFRYAISSTDPVRPGQALAASSTLSTGQSLGESRK